MPSVHPSTRSFVRSLIHSFHPPIRLFIPSFLASFRWHLFRLSLVFAGDVRGFLALREKHGTSDKTKQNRLLTPAVSGM